MLIALLVTDAEDAMGQLTVGDLMTTAVLKVRPTTPFKELARVMEEHHISALPVVDSDDQLMGIVSEADLLPKQELHGQRPAHRWAFSGRQSFSAERSAGDNAGQVMTTNVVTIGPGATLTETTKLMTERKVKRLPVVGQTGALVGIISRADLIKVFVRPDDEIKEEILREVFVHVLWADPSAVQIVVRDGIVTLAGNVEQKSTIPIAERLTRRVDDIIDVVNHLTYLVDDSRSVRH
jgi:CBS domain-containing protein